MIDLLGIICLDLDTDDKAGIIKRTQIQKRPVVTESTLKAVTLHHFLLCCGLQTLSQKKPASQEKHAKKQASFWRRWKETLRLCSAHAGSGCLPFCNSTRLLFARTTATTHYLSSVKHNCTASSRHYSAHFPWLERRTRPASATPLTFHA